eukprot:249977_1
MQNNIDNHRSMLRNHHSKQCKLAGCAFLKRIINILTLYKSYLQFQQQNKHKNLQEFTMEYQQQEQDVLEMALNEFKNLPEKIDAANLDSVINDCLSEFSEINEQKEQDVLLCALNEFENTATNKDVEHIDQVLSDCLGSFAQQTATHNVYDIFCNINQDYNSVALLNDFHHLLFYHSHQFESIHNILSKRVYKNVQCRLSNCLVMKRNYRNRKAITKKKLNELYFDYDDIVPQQLIDCIHCFYFHSFDTGMKLTNEDRNNIINHA